MTIQVLIDAIVRQTTVLIAELATAGGARAPLSRLANQVFLDLTDELYAQGVSRKVSADMFGMALRTYLRKIQRLRESSTDGGASLWEAVLSYLNENGLVSRADVLGRFHRDDPELVAAVLHDLSETGLVLRTGSGPTASFRGATADELKSLPRASGEGLDELVWAIVYREGPLSLVELAKRIRGGDLPAALVRLCALGRIERTSDAEPSYATRSFVIPLSSAVGWEGAVLDHFQALVKTIAARLRADVPDDAMGGSTYGFDIWPGHPHESEVFGLLREVRKRTSDLRDRVTRHNAEAARPTDYVNVTFYAGQCAIAQQGV